MIGLMHNGVLAVEHPMIGVRPLDPHAGFVAGDDPGAAKNGLGLVRRELEPRMGADEHVHQCALADDEAESLAEQEAQALVGKGLKALQINRQRMDARSKWRRRGDRGRRSFYSSAALRATASETPMAHDVGLDRWDLDLIVFTDQFHLGVRRHSPAAELAMRRSVIAEFVGIVGETTIVGLMPGLRPARTRVLALLFFVGGRRLR